MSEPNRPSSLNPLNPNRLFATVPEQTIRRDRPTHQQIHLDTGSIKILSWNVARTNHRQSWAEDYQIILEQHQPDLIFLQEVRLDVASEEISALSHMGWHFAPNFLNAVNRSYSGLLTAAHTNPKSSHTLLTEHVEPVANTPKVALFTTYDLPQSSETLLTANIHAINFVRLGKFQAQLQAIAARLLQHTGPILFSGDFNTWNRARWHSLQATTNALSLKSVIFPPASQKHLKRFLLSPPLDHIFYRGFSQEPFSATVIDTLNSSDHNPLLVELTRKFDW